MLLLKAFGDRDDESSLPSGFRGSFLDEINCILNSSPQKLKQRFLLLIPLSPWPLIFILKGTSDIAHWIFSTNYEKIAIRMWRNDSIFQLQVHLCRIHFLHEYYSPKLPVSTPRLPPLTSSWFHNWSVLDPHPQFVRNALPKMPTVSSSSAVADIGSRFCSTECFQSTRPSGEDILSMMATVPNALVTRWTVLMMNFSMTCAIIAS